nr:phospholipase D zeta 1-like isoform X2 [Ipomoea batatas]
MTSMEQLVGAGGVGPMYMQMQSEPSSSPSMTSSLLTSHHQLQQCSEAARIFDELPKATIVQFKWQLVKKASQVFYLHFALKRRLFIEEIHEKQEQVVFCSEIVPSSAGTANNPSHTFKTNSMFRQSEVHAGCLVGDTKHKLRAKSIPRVKDWVAAINDAGLKPPEGGFDPLPWQLRKQIRGQSSSMPWHDVHCAPFGDHLPGTKPPNEPSNSNTKLKPRHQYGYSPLHGSQHRTHTEMKMLVIANMDMICNDQPNMEFQLRISFPFRKAQVELFCRHADERILWMKVMTWIVRESCSSSLDAYWNQSLNKEWWEAQERGNKLFQADETCRSLVDWLDDGPVVLAGSPFLHFGPRGVSLRQCLAHWKEKIGHTTIDLGIAPNKLESYQDGDIKGTDPMERLVSVRGHLVSFPLDFMSREDLRPMFNESEYYASPQVFH